MPSPLFRGWTIVAVAVVGQCFSVGTMLVFTFGVFAKPLAGAFGASRGTIALAVSVLDLMCLLAAPAAGRLVDRHEARVVIVTSVLVLAACLFGLSHVQPPLWHLFALYGCAGFFGIATSPVTHARVVSSWFNRRRGLALGVASTGIGLGAFVMPSLAQALIDRGGWRGAYLGLCGLSLLTIPVIGLFLRGRPEDVGLAPDGEPRAPSIAHAPAVVPGLSVGQALRTRTFWHLCAIFFFMAACVNGAMAHLVPLLTDRGMSGRDAALATSLFGAASLAGRVGNGALVDRHFAPRVTALLFTGAAAGVAILLAGGSAFVAAPLLGLAIGAESDVMPLLVSRYFGMRAMAELFGCAFGAYTLGNATGRYLFAAGFDASGSYRLPLAVALGVLGLAIAATALLGRYPSPESLRDAALRADGTGGKGQA